MNRSPRPVQVLAAASAGLAGFVDALGFLHLGGFFVSFMSGNSTRLAVGLAEGSAAGLWAAALIAAFVAGVVVGTLIGGAVRHHRLSLLLALVGVLLGIAAAAASLAVSPLTCGLVLAVAMGAINAGFEQDGEIRFGVTYMTGALVKVGQRIAIALRGGDPWGWLPYLVLWAGLAAGATAGAALYALAGIGALWIAALLAGALSLIAFAR